jgi:manganese transport system substrate-binding protein
MAKPTARSWRTLLVAALALGLAACGAPADDGGPPKVLATFTVIADMAREVAGGRLVVESITKPGSEIHEYEPTPDDLVRGRGADLVLDNGLGLERWFERFADRTGVPTATLSEGVEPIPISIGAYQGRPNPHAWMSPQAGEVYVRNIADAFAELDPPNAAFYRANADAYAARLRAVADELRTALAALPADQRALVTCEGAFSYLARDAGLAEGYLWPVNAESEGTPQQIAAVVGFVRENRVPAVFCESTVDDGPQQQVARETGARVGPVLYVDSLSEPGGPVPTYLDLLTYDARAIVEGLTGRSPA